MLNSHPPRCVLIRSDLLADGIRSASQKDYAVLVTEGRITAVGPAQIIAKQIPPDTETIGVTDIGTIKTLIPADLLRQRIGALLRLGNSLAECGCTEYPTAVGDHLVTHHARAGVEYFLAAGL